MGTVGGFSYLGRKYPALPFEISYALDSDKHAVETYNYNFRHKAVCEDIKNIDASSISDFELLLGGFPCQSFSTVNPKKDTNDDRANLYREIVKILEAKRPKFFIAENVKGLMILKKGEILRKIINDFKSAGYTVQYKLMSASDFGIPQKRERLFIVGIRKDIILNFAFPGPALPGYSAVPLSAVIKTLNIADKKYYFSKKAVEGMKNARNNMKRGLYQNLSGQCLTITSHLSKTSLNSRDPVLLVDPENEIYRRFTPEEAAKIQSFPDNFKFPVADTQAYRQIGNAIPPVLMWHIVKALADCIAGSTATDSLS